MNDYVIAILVLSIVSFVLFVCTYALGRILTQPIVGKWSGLIVFATAIVTTFMAFGVARSGIGEDYKLSTIFFVSYLITTNFVVAPFLYKLDKSRAKRKGSERIPELSLHAVAYIGGPVGAILSQRIFRHKTKKPKFQYISWAALAICFGIALVLGMSGG